MKAIRSILVTLAALIALFALSAPAAQADTKGLADSIMRMDYNTFIQYKGIRAPRPFNWSSDGCSWPTPASLRHLFNLPCQQHDFGYRNYGNGLRLGRNGNVRAWIDDRFLTEMRRLCIRTFYRLYQRGNQATCRGQASAMWTAVRHGGRDAFYNG